MLSTLFIIFNVLLTPELDSIFDQVDEGQKIPVIIRMAQEYPYDIIANLPIKERAMVLKNIAKESQKPLIDFLNEFVGEFDGLKKFWVFNGLCLNATKRLIKILSMRQDISLISHIPEIRLPPEDLREDKPSRTPEWNIQKVMADSCWHRGYTGENIFIGHLDTGVDFNHPALQGKWSGKWRDFIYNHPSPYDDHGHGSFNAGIICGGDGLGPFQNDIGVAPGVKIIPAKIFTNYEVPLSIILEAMQWMASLKVDSGYNIRAVSNSWGFPYSLFYFWDAACTWKILEILPVFAIGNYGPAPNATAAPGNYPVCIGAGATDSLDVIASFSSRGPAPDSSPWNNPQYWYRPDWNLTKPDIVAPGVSVRSAYYGNNYNIMNGTNISAPHIAGAVAILCGANPNLTITEIYNILLDNADRPSQGGPYPNNNYGWGRLNIWRALQNVLMISERKQVSITRPFIIKPNPNRGRIYFDERFEDCIIKLYDATGRLVMEEKYIGINDINIPTSVKNGVYFLKMKMHDGEKTGTFILIR